MIDRKVYNVASDLQAVSGTAADILNTLPSVDVDADGNVSLRGDSKVTILVDGKPSAQLTGSLAGEGLQQFAANNIEKIEVMTNPPAEYRADGTGGVINIITKKGRKPGSSGSLTFNAGNQHRYVLGASAAYNTERLNLYGGAGLRQDDRQRIVSSGLTTIGPGVNQTVSADLRDEHARRVIPTVNGGLDYQLNDGQSLGLDFNFRQRSGTRYFDQQSTSRLPDGTLASASAIHDDGHEWSLSGEQRLRFKQNLGGPEQTIELALHRSTNREREGYGNLRTSTLPIAGQSEDTLSPNHGFQSNDAALDYRTVLAEGQVIKLGYDWKHDHNGYTNFANVIDPASGALVPNPDLTNSYLYVQTVQALYGSYEQTVGKWSIVTGARAEHTVSDGVQQGAALATRKSYGGIYPSLHLERVLDDASTLSIGYSHRLSRPDPEDLNPYINHQDVHLLRGGNPDLLPQDTQSLDLGYRVESKKHSYGVNGYLRHIKNSFTDVTVLVGPDVLLATKANLPKSSDGGLDFDASGPLTSALSYRLSGNAFYTQIDATALGAAGLKSTTGLNAKASLNYRPGPLDTAQISFSRTDKRLTPQGYVSPINLVNVGYRRQLQANLSLVMTVSDVLNGQRFQRFLSTPTLVQSYQRYQSGKIAYIGLAYLFGTGKKAKSDGFDYDH